MKDIQVHHTYIHVTCSMYIHVHMYDVYMYPEASHPINHNVTCNTYTWHTTHTWSFTYIHDIQINTYIHVYLCIHTYIHVRIPVYMCTCTKYQSTVGFRCGWAWTTNEESENLRRWPRSPILSHNINTSIKTRVILSFYNVSCSLSDTWFAEKRKNIFFTRPTNTFFHFWFFISFFYFWFFSIPSPLFPFSDLHET